MQQSKLVELGKKVEEVVTYCSTLATVNTDLLLQRLEWFCCRQIANHHSTDSIVDRLNSIPHYLPNRDAISVLMSKIDFKLPITLSVLELKRLYETLDDALLRLIYEILYVIDLEGI